MTSRLAEPLEQLLEATRTAGGDLLLCSCCRHPITSEGEQITVGVAHDYCFTNPAGISYHIRCYHNAPGCSLVGEATGEHSWFGGYHWQLAVCAECQEHLGWYYQNARQRYFFGLIPTRLQMASDARD